MLIKGKNPNKLVNIFDIVLIVTLIKGIRQAIINLKKQSNKAS
jgi:hypothetical protein